MGTCCAFGKSSLEVWGAVVPELPEVEITRENLERWLGHRTIKRARVQDRRVLRGQSVRRVQTVLAGARLQGIHRRGKYLIWRLVDRPSAVTHLGMSGKFVLRHRDDPDPSATCVTLELEDGSRVVYSDTRRLGRFQIEEGETRERLARIGIDALDRGLTTLRLRELLRSARLPIKSFLMDQHRVAGLGNIQSVEALFQARIHPSRPASRLSEEEIGRLQKAIHVTLRQTLRRERSAEIRYLQEADWQNTFLVYDREGEPCLRCGAPVRRTVHSGRSTYYCATCQPRRPRSLPGSRRSKLATKKGRRHEER
jgi:formamidopyrimidine-DNA glycosylase